MKKVIATSVLFMSLLSLTAQEAGSMNSENATKTELKQESASVSENEEGDEKQDPNRIIVTASKTRTSEMDTPADVTVVEEKRIHDAGTKNPLESLNETPGFVFNPRQDGGMFDHYQLRGLYSNSTSGGTMLILIDGIPQRRLSFGGPYTGGLPLDAVNRIELVKGAMSSLYGRNALAGAMQMFTDPGTKEFHAVTDITGEYGVFGVKGSAKVTGPVFNFGTFSLTGSLLSARGHVNDSAQQKGDLYAHINLEPTSKDRIKIIAGFVDLHQGTLSPQWINDKGERLDIFDRDRNYMTPGAYGDLREWRAGTHYTHLFPNNLTFNYKASYWKGYTIWDGGRLNNKPSEGTIDKRSNAGHSVYDENSFFNETELNWKFRLNSNFKGFITAGGSYEYLDWDFSDAPATTKELLEETGGYTGGVPIDVANPVNPDPGQIVYGPSSGRFTYEHHGGAFLRSGMHIFKIFHLEGGVRFDGFTRTQESDDGRSVHYKNHAFSPGAGLNVSLIKKENYKLNIYGNWGMGFSPVFRAVNNVRFTDLKPERSMSTEGGLKWNFLKNAIEGKVLYFLMDRKDVTGWINDPDHEGDMLGVNSGDWRIHGLEFELKGRPYKDWFTIYGSFAWQNATITKNEIKPEREGNDVAMVSPLSFTIGGRAELPVGLLAGIEYRLYSKRFADEENKITLAPYGILDADLGWKLKIQKLGSASASFFLRNATDADYVSGVGGDGTGSYGWFLTPRTFGIKISLAI